MKKIIIAFAILITMGLSFGPSVSQAQIKFVYAATSHLDHEGEKWYVYTECNEYEGNSCATPDAVIREDVTELIRLLKEVFFIIIF